MKNNSLTICILAAGRGNRMKSNTPKVLHEISGVPMIHSVLKTAKKLNPEKVIVIAGYKKELVVSLYSADVLSNKSGWIKEVDTRKLGLLLIELGGGRKQVNDNINYQVGFDNVIGIGDSVDASTPIIQVHAKSKDDFERTKNQIIKCFTLSDRKVSPLQPIYERIS